MEQQYHRTYTTDFDLYKAGAESFENREVEIYLAVNLWIYNPLPREGI